MVFCSSQESEEHPCLHSSPFPSASMSSRILWLLHLKYLISRLPQSYSPDLSCHWLPYAKSHFYCLVSRSHSMARVNLETYKPGIIPLLRTLSGFPPACLSLCEGFEKSNHPLSAISNEWVRFQTRFPLWSGFVRSAETYKKTQSLEDGLWTLYSLVSASLCRVTSCQSFTHAFWSYCPGSVSVPWTYPVLTHIFAKPPAVGKIFSLSR